MLLFLFFFFKQKTAYEMRISDWSSDVFSSDLSLFPPGERVRSTPAALRRSASRGAHAAAGTALMAMGLSGGGGRRRGGRGTRSEERRVGKEGVSTCRYRWSQDY